MKCIGIIGGMSYESTGLYYQRINQEIQRRLGGHHSGRILIHSVDFEEVLQWQHKQDWNSIGEHLAQAAQGLEKAGAEGILIATNTMHQVAETVRMSIKIPLLHLVEAIADEIDKRSLGQVAILGTEFTMTAPFYRDILKRRGVATLAPDAEEKQEISRIIYEELCFGQTLADSRQFYVKVANRLAERGAEGVILGCTEIPMLIGPEDVAVPLLDSTDIHVNQAVNWMLGAEDV